MSETTNSCRTIISPSSALAVLSSKKGHHFIHEDKIIIGRSPNAFLCITESYVSRRHCAIEKQENNTFTICDMSNSGTFVNDKKLIKNKPQELNHLDRIKIADDEAHSYVFLINKKRIGITNSSRMATSSPLREKMNNLNCTQFLEAENINKELDLVEAQKLKLKEKLQEQLSAQKELEKERLKIEKESSYNKEQAEKLEKKLKETLEEKERIMKEYELKIKANNEREEELQKAKNDMTKRHSDEREELENKCKAEIEELKKKLEISQSQNQLFNEMEKKLEEVQSALLDSELEQQRLFEAKVKVETKLEKKVLDLTNDAEKVKELEIKLKEKEGLEEKVKKEMEGLEDDIMCSICAEIYIEPTALNCGHMFCKQCISEWSKKKKICPMCRAKIVSTIRIYNMDSVIQRNIRLMSEEAQSRRETLIEERKNGRASKIQKPPKKRRREVPNVMLPEHRPLPRTPRTTLDTTIDDVLRQDSIIGDIIALNRVLNPRQMRHITGFGTPIVAVGPPTIEGDDPFQEGWVTNAQSRNVHLPGRNSPVTIAAVDLTNVSTPTRSTHRTHTVTSADANTTIDLTNF